MASCGPPYYPLVGIFREPACCLYTTLHEKIILTMIKGIVQFYADFFHKDSLGGLCGKQATAVCCLSRWRKSVIHQFCKAHGGRLTAAQGHFLTSKLGFATVVPCCNHGGAAMSGTCLGGKVTISKPLVIGLLFSLAAGCASLGHYYGEGQAYYQTGRYDDAISAYYRAAEQEPQRVDVQIGLAMAFEKKGLADEALSAWEKAWSLDNSNAEVKGHLVQAYYDKGQAYRQAGKVSDAYEVWQKALQLDPEHTAVRTALAQLYSDQGEDDKAALQYQQLTTAQPRDAAAYQSLGLVYYKQGKFNEAIEAFQQVLRLDPQNAQAFNNLGTAYLQSERVDEALSAFEQAAGIDPNLAETYNNWGTAFFKQGRYGQAREKWALVLRLNPGNETATKNLETLETLGY